MGDAKGEKNVSYMIRRFCVFRLAFCFLRLAEAIQH